jgi:hypothetical protein
MRIFLFRPHPWQIRVLCKVPRPPFFSAALISIYQHIAGVEEWRRPRCSFTLWVWQSRDGRSTILTFDIDDIPQQNFLSRVCATVGVTVEQTGNAKRGGRRVGCGRLSPVLAMGVLCQPV